jgi:uncharacterized protein (DUF1684 family)
VSALSLLDWRRRVAALYAEVRDLRGADPAVAHARWVAGRDTLFATHDQSPIPAPDRAAFAGLDVFAYDPGLAFTAVVDTDAAPERFALPRSGGIGDGPATMAFSRVGEVDLPVGRLPVYWLDAYGGGLFLPFRDATSGQQTYGGGRYLLDTVKGADLGSTPDGALVCDFNFAYHPSCHYDAAWSCPLPPPDSWLDAPVQAGERLTG